MKTLIGTGQPEAMVAFADTGMPAPKPSEALVKVDAFSVNRGEIFLLEDYPGDVPLSGKWRGREAILNDFLGSLGGLLKPGSWVQIELTNVVSDGTQVVAEWTSRRRRRQTPAGARWTRSPRRA